MLSVIQDPSLTYPDGSSFFSPDEKFPEYAFDHVSSSPNPVYRAVREMFAQAGLDAENYGSPAWNPLRELVPEGSRVFVLCNFVRHKHHSQNVEGFRAKCTHGSTLRAAIDYLLLAVGPEGRITFGNAPMFDAHWDSLLVETEADKVLDFYQSVGKPVAAKDLRLIVTLKNRAGAITWVERRPDSDGIAVDLGCDSLMTELDRRSPKYRIMFYGNQRMSECHNSQRHAYVIHRDIIESDVVFSLAKLKTHEKAGITVAMKSFVGTVGHKDSLPHHRFGPPEVGGDEYPTDPHGGQRLASVFHELASSTNPGTRIGSALRVADRFMRLAPGVKTAVREGAWWGNDTAWRMVVDLTRALTYSDLRGVLREEPTRKLYYLVDGIIAGEGEGPLSPEPVRSGVLTFSDNPLVTDYAAALLMGYRPEKLPTVKGAMGLGSFPLFRGDVTRERIVRNGESYVLSQLGEFADHHFATPRGWEGIL